MNNQRELKRYIRLPSGKFIDTQVKREDGLTYMIKTIDDVPNWLCLVEEDGWGRMISLQFDTSDDIWELLKDDDYAKIRNKLHKITLVEYTALNGKFYSRYVIEDIEYGDYKYLDEYLKGYEIGLNGRCEVDYDQIDGIFTWQDEYTLKQVWSKEKGVIEW